MQAERGYIGAAARRALRALAALAMVCHGAAAAGADKKLDDALVETIRSAEQGNYAAVRRLLKRGANPNAVWSDDRRTPLMEAASVTDAPMCRLLLHAGARANARDRDGDTALMAAIAEMEGDSADDVLDVVGVLLKAGADPNLANRDKVTPLVAACSEGIPPARADLVRLLIAHGAKVTGHALVQAAESHNKPCVRALLKAGAGRDRDAVADALDAARHDGEGWDRAEQKACIRALEQAARKAGQDGRGGRRRQGSIG